MDEADRRRVAAVLTRNRAELREPSPSSPYYAPRGTRRGRLAERGIDHLSRAVGEALRRARREQGLSLRAAAARSGSRFKASSLGAYERAERRISLERFSELAPLYNTSPDRLMSQALDLLDPASRRSVVIDLTRLTAVPAPERSILEEFVQRLRDRRRDLLSKVITLRSGDVETLALVSGIGSERLMERLRPALRQESEAG
jgi:transcriptional regulator with XRE-family HTH domain